MHKSKDLRDRWDAIEGNINESLSLLEGVSKAIEDEAEERGFREEQLRCARIIYEQITWGYDPEDFEDGVLPPDEVIRGVRFWLKLCLAAVLDDDEPYVDLSIEQLTAFVNGETQ